jgi:vacuolar-type H+-ATPase subunit E/Vma4
MSESSMELEAQLIERILEKRNKLLEDADKQVEKITKSAKETVTKINSDSETEILSLIGSDLNAARDRIEVLERLRGIEGRDDAKFDKGEVLIALIKEAAAAVGGEEFIISGNEADLKYLKKNLGNVRKALKQSVGESKVSLDSEPFDTGGGVVVKNSDGTKTYYNTFEGRLATVKAKLESEIAEKLGVL